MAARDGDVGYDQLHHFIVAGVWNASPLEKVLLAEADRMVGGGEAWLIIDDTALPKKGERSVGRRAAIRLGPGQERQLSDPRVADVGFR
jgi:SRSO17 transposase